MEIAGLLPAVISVGECDPLCEKGAALHAEMHAAGCGARLRVVDGACHSTKLFLTLTTDFAAATAAHVAAFAAAPDAALEALLGRRATRCRSGVGAEQQPGSLRTWTHRG